MLRALKKGSSSLDGQSGKSQSGKKDTGSASRSVIRLDDLEAYSKGVKGKGGITYLGTIDMSELDDKKQE